MDMEEFMETYFHTRGVQEQINRPVIPPRLLRANWSQELVQDLQMMHGLDAEQMLSEILTEELDQELGLSKVVDHFKGNEDIFKI
jgi:hypothetical protein